jgi:hypothetical protein
MADGKVRRIDVPDEILAVDTLGNPNYSCAFELTGPLTDTRSAEDWLRGILEDAAMPMRLFILTGWVAALRLRLGPRPSPDHILGWKILSARPAEIIIGVEGAVLSAHQVVQVKDGKVVHATIVRYDRPVANVLWAASAPIHVRTIPYLMKHAR